MTHRSGRIYLTAKNIFIDRQYTPFRAKEMIDKGIIDNKNLIRTLKDEGYIIRLSGKNRAVHYSIWQLKLRAPDFWK